MEFNTRHINFNGIVNSLPLSWQRFLGSVRNARKEDLPLMIVSQCKTTFKNEPTFWSNSNKAFPKKISFWSNKAFPKKIKWKILWSSSLFYSINQTWKKKIMIYIRTDMYLIHLIYASFLSNLITSTLWWLQIVIIKLGH